MAKLKSNRSYPVILSMAIWSVMLILGLGGGSAMSDNNMSEQNIEICTHQLMEIGNALNAYRKEHGDFPMWLSNLHPEYLKDKKLLICPADRSAGSPAFSSNKDPELPVSYDYQLTPSYREWKSDQHRIYGDIVPLIRCRHHASEDRKDFVINLSHALEIYESSGIWERHPRVLDNLLGNLKRYISERSLEGQTNIGRRTHGLVSTLTEDQQTELRVFVEKTIQSQPENGTAYKILGVLQVVKGDELGALDTFAQAMPMLQHDAETHSIAGELYSKHNRIEEAIDAFEMVLQLLPQDRGIFPRLTHLYVQSGRHKDGEALISRFKSIMRDDDPGDGLILSNMLMEVKRYEEAREVAENVLAKEPENREALSMLAEIHEALGNADLAREYQIKLDPTIAWIGKAAPEFSAKDLDGNPISLKDYRGKIVLLDFWAVWCGPCVEEMPNVKKVYEEYHDRNFDIIGISLDTSEEKLRSFIRDREIPWRQIFSGKGWNSPVSRMYGIRAIPAPWLIDRDGRVISTRARGNRLEQLVAEAVGEKVGSSARRIPEQPRSESVEYYDKEKTEQVRPDEVEPLAGPSADPFEGASLQNPGWIWQNEPANWDVGITRKGWLHIAAENDQNLWDVDTVAKLYQEVSTDKFDVETHLVINYQGTDSVLAGLVAKGPKEDNWVTLKLWGTGRYGGDAILEWQHKQQDLWQQGLLSEAPGSSQLGRKAEVFIRIAKDGDEYIGYWKTNEDDEWLEITPHAKIRLTPPLEVGIYAGIESVRGTATMEFEYFSDL